MTDSDVKRYSLSELRHGIESRISAVVSPSPPDELTPTARIFCEVVAGRQVGPAVVEAGLLAELEELAEVEEA